MTVDGVIGAPSGAPTGLCRLHLFFMFDIKTKITKTRRLKLSRIIT